MVAMTSCGLFRDPLPPEAQSNYVVGDYKIGPEDALEVFVWGSEELSRTVMVRPDGKISLPLVGELEAMGLTAAQLTEEIQSRLQEYKKDPNVTVVVQGVNSYNIFIMGEVAGPGKYPLRSYATILQAIAQAGGLGPFADQNDMFVIRKGVDGAPDVRINIRYDDILSGDDPTQNLLLIPGDTLVVP